MKVRFQADADLNQMIVKATLRREPSIDFQTAHEAKLVGLNDEQVLTIAAKEERILVTHDRKTMPTHFADFISKQNSSGVIIIPQRFFITKAIDDLILIWSASELEEWVNRIQSIPL